MKKFEEVVEEEKITLPAEAEEYIIGIGASAGGFDAIHTLFDHTPNDAVSYVIVQHLSPDHKSMMKELLAKHSKLKIFVAEDQMKVVSNCVYVLPEGKTMTISGNKLILKDRQNSQPNSAIDIFFNSLAEDLGRKSVAIVLSGNGSDGTKGIEAIKKVGGMVIVQSPKSTAFSSMPTNAINSGYYDYILDPVDIALQIIKYIKQRTLTANFQNTPSEINEEALLKINTLIKEHTPLDFSEYKRPTIIRRIARRMAATNTESVNDYIRILEKNPDEIEIITKEFLISVTKFFRDPDAFDIIAEKVIPEIIENKLLVDVLKVWVIGCATGEEAYSLAILIKEYLLETKKDIEVKIFASDIDKGALAKASKGCYPKSIENDVSESRLNKFFSKEGNQYKVRDSIRKMIIFADHDIIHQPPYGKIDLISCRNLMIYFNPVLQKKIFSTLTYCLSTDGCLFLGPSEGLGVMKKFFNETDKKWKIFKKTEKNNKLQYKTYSSQNVEAKKYSYPTLTLKTTKNIVPENITELLQRSTLEETHYLAGACIDYNYDITLPFGEFEKYLLPKLFKTNLLDLLPSDLARAVVTTIKKAAKENQKITVKDINFEIDGVSKSVTIMVKPFVDDNMSHNNFSILYFSDGLMEQNGLNTITSYNKSDYTDSYVADLEEDIAEANKIVRDAYESLDESNNNIQAYNEELISSNEEMQSSNEELQSINEELNTVNHEYQIKIKELAELNDDLDNYFKSTYITQIYVDNDVNLKKYNPLTISQINIKESDIGRPLGDISNNIKYSTLSADVRRVIKTEERIEKQIQTTDGKWYIMMIVPYIRSQDNEIDGAIITFNDITAIQQSKEIIKETNRKLVEINKDHDTFIYSASHDLKAPLNNMEGLLSYLTTSEDLEELKIFILPLIESVIRLKDTINDLSDITKIEQEVEHSEEINLLKLLEEVKRSISVSLRAITVDFEIDFRVENIKFSKKNLRSIFINLLSNAIKYRHIDRDLKIIIKSKRIADFVELSFEDNGIGIEEEHIRDIFAKFKRVNSGINVAEGSGIGLFLVKKIAENAGGSISVVSKYGQGSCFKILINEKEKVQHIVNLNF